MLRILYKILHLILVLELLASCSSQNNAEPELQAIDNTILRPQGAMVQSRPLLYKNDPTISYCESTAGTQSTYSGYRDLKPYVLASVSKIFLSAWVLNTLGPDYRFQMNWKLKKISNDGTYDAYLQTNYDPIVNIEKILFALSELNKKGVRRIRHLVIDETTRIYLSVLLNPHLELSDVPVTSNQTIENLNRILNSSNWASQTETAKNNLNQTMLNLKIPDQFSVESVTMLPQSQINLNVYNESLQIQSALLAKYIKHINVFSNNYVTDSFFAFLGGQSGFKKFQTEQLKISLTELNILTGSGLSIEIDGARFDNTGTCMSVLKTLKYLDVLSNKYNLNLGHVLLTAGSDQGTYESNLKFDRNLVVKTGRLFDVPALNISGITSTNVGNTYFAMLAHDFDNDDEIAIKNKRDDLIADLINQNKPKPSFLTMVLSSIFL